MCEAIEPTPPMALISNNKTKQEKHILAVATVVTTFSIYFRFSGKHKSCMHRIFFRVTQFINVCKLN